MQTQNAPTEFLIKFWPWFEANRKRLIGMAVAATVILLAFYFYTTQQAQKAVDAGRAYTQMQLNLPPTATLQQVADGYQQVAKQYPGTLAAERAQLQVGSALFSAGRYADAQAVFQKFADASAGGMLAPEAQLGVAASLEAQNQLEPAAAAYRAVMTGFPNSTEVWPAKFALARVLEAQGKFTEAASYYTEVARSQVAGSLATEAAQRMAQIQSKIPAPKPAATAPVPAK